MVTAATSDAHPAGLPTHDPSRAAAHETEGAPPVDVLRRVFGYDAFRGDQADIVDTLVRGDDALVLMPTGGGKSLCYQVPALVRRGVGVVVSPLIALMQDQVDALSALGVRAAEPDHVRDGDRCAAAARRIGDDAVLAQDHSRRRVLPRHPAGGNGGMVAGGHRAAPARKVR